MQSVGVTWLGHSDLAGRSDGLQLVGAGTRLFVSHLFSGGFTEVDVADPRAPASSPSPRRHPDRGRSTCRCSLLLVANGPDMWSRPAGFDPGRTLFDNGDPFAAGPYGCST